MSTSPSASRRTRRWPWATACGCGRPTSTPPWRCTSASTWLTETRSSTSGTWTCAAGDPASEVDGEGAEGAGAVADGLLLLGRHLGEGAAVAVGGDDDRVVAEPALTSRRHGDGALHHTALHHLAAVGPDGGRRA